MELLVDEHCVLFLLSCLLCVLSGKYIKIPVLFHRVSSTCWLNANIFSQSQPYYGNSLFDNNLKESHQLSLSTVLILSLSHHLIWYRGSENSTQTFPPNETIIRLEAITQNKTYRTRGITAHICAHLYEQHRTTNWKNSFGWSGVNIFQRQQANGWRKKAAKQPNIYIYEMKRSKTKYYYLWVRACWSHYYWKASLLSYKHSANKFAIHYT